MNSEPAGQVSDAAAAAALAPVPAEAVFLPKPANVMRESFSSPVAKQQKC